MNSQTATAARPEGQAAANLQDNLSIDYPSRSITPSELQQIRDRRKADFNQKVENHYEALLWAKKHRAPVIVTLHCGAKVRGTVSERKDIINVLEQADSTSVFDFLKVSAVEVHF